MILAGTPIDDSRCLVVTIKEYGFKCCIVSIKLHFVVFTGVVDANRT